jgi:hypothetical protein
VTFTVTNHRAVGPLYDGNLSETGTVTIKNGIICDVTAFVGRSADPRRLRDEGCEITRHRHIPRHSHVPYLNANRE